MPIDARINTGLPHHPKTKKLIRRVGCEGAWHLVCLMLWTAQNRPDGELDGMDAEDVEIASGWEGEPEAFTDALVDVRFLEVTEDGYRIRNWAKHNPWAAGAEARSNRARFAALCKQHGRKVAAEMMPEYAKSLLEDSDKDANGKLNGANSTPPAHFSSAPSPSPSPSLKDLSGKSDMPAEVFSYWQEVHKHPRAKLDDKRRKRILARLKDGYTVDDLKLAIDGCKRSPHHMGENDTRTVYDDLELICRDAPHVDKFIALAEGKSAPPEPEPPSRRYLS